MCLLALLHPARARLAPGTGIRALAARFAAEKEKVGWWQGFTWFRTSIDKVLLACRAHAESRPDCPCISTVCSAASHGLQTHSEIVSKTLSSGAACNCSHVVYRRLEYQGPAACTALVADLPRQEGFHAPGMPKRRTDMMRMKACCLGFSPRRSRCNLRLLHPDIALLQPQLVRC